MLQCRRESIRAADGRLEEYGQDCISGVIREGRGSGPRRAPCGSREEAERAPAAMFPCVCLPSAREHIGSRAPAGDYREEMIFKHFTLKYTFPSAYICIYLSTDVAA